jgi:hypothetical protein
MILLIKLLNIHCSHVILSTETALNTITNQVLCFKHYLILKRHLKYRE